MDYFASIDFLYGLQRFGIKLGLENMHELKNRLPLLQDPLACVHIAGTNGKGSVSVLLAEILQHSGLRVGLYTSPHLHSFTERIRINGTPLEQSEVADLAETIRHVANDIPITFFEATTAMALLAFKKHRVDIAVIETGLGGRLDATNVVAPLLCMITPVSFDHSEHLGTSLAEIAAEKAGILKSGAPVVVGRQSAEAEAVILEQASALDAQVLLSGRDFFWQGGHDLLSVTVGQVCVEGLRCNLAGLHQLDNYAQAVAGAMVLRGQGYPVSDAAVKAAGETVVWPGRLEWCGSERQILMDVSHNRAGIDCLAGYLAEENVSRVHLVVGLSGVRSPAEVLLPLVKYAVAVYAVPVSAGQSVSTVEMIAWAEQEGVPATAYNSPAEGLAAALSAVKPDEHILICGSLYLVAELREQLLNETLLSTP